MPTTLVYDDAAGNDSDNDDTTTEAVYASVKKKSPTSEEKQIKYESVSISQQQHGIENCRGMYSPK